MRKKLIEKIHHEPRKIKSNSNIKFIHSIKLTYGVNLKFNLNLAIPNRKIV